MRIGDKGAKNIGVSKIGKISSWKGGPKKTAPALLRYNKKTNAVVYFSVEQESSR